MSVYPGKVKIKRSSTSLATVKLFFFPVFDFSLLPVKTLIAHDFGHLKKCVFQKNWPFAPVFSTQVSGPPKYKIL